MSKINLVENTDYCLIVAGEKHVQASPRRRRQNGEGTYRTQIKFVIKFFKFFHVLYS